MRFFEIPALAMLLASLWALPVHAADATAPAEPTVETYQLKTTIDGKTVTTYIHLFPESPFDNPDLLKQIRESQLDHVAFLDEVEISRAPSQVGDLENLKSKIESETSVPVVEIKQKKGFFKRLRQMWDLSFKDPVRRPGKADYRYGLVSTVGESALFTAMVFSSPNIPIENGIALVAVQTLLSYANNVWNNSINHFLSSSIKQLGKPATEKTYFFRNLSYDFLTSQIFKLVQSARALLSWSTQSTIFMNTLMVGAGDVLTSNTAYRGFQGDKVKLAKMNFYVSAVSTLFGSLDLMQHHAMPVLFEIGAYDFRMSGAILIAYYAGVVLALNKVPDQLYQFVDRFDRGLQRAGKWLVQRVAHCGRIFGGGRPASSDSIEPPQI